MAIATTESNGFRMTAAEKMAGEAYIDQLFAERNALSEAPQSALRSPTKSSSSRSPVGVSGDGMTPDKKRVLEYLGDERATAR